MARRFNILLNQIFLAYSSLIQTYLLCVALPRSCTATAEEVGEARHPHNSTSLGEEMDRLDTLLEEASMVVAFQTEVVEDFVVEETSKEVAFQTEAVEDFEVEETSREVFLKGSLVERLIEEAFNLDMTFRT